MPGDPKKSLTGGALILYQVLMAKLLAVSKQLPSFPTETEHYGHPI